MLTPNQKDWEFTVDLTNAPLYGVFMDLPAGVNPGKITGTSTNKEGNVQVNIVTKAGLPCTITLGTDISKAGNLANWLKLCLSTGAPEAKLRQQVTIKSASLVGKEVFVFAKERGEGEEYQDRKFITPQEAQELMQQQAPAAPKANGAAAAAPAAPAGAPTTPQPAAGGFSL